ncbi:hypothetical protein H0H92_010434 [Tricholoma furcatifolium]|nr:hypothetical protein H0H92_010434 [Tricholoma furcatifolium]
MLVARDSAARHLFSVEPSFNLRSRATEAGPGIDMAAANKASRILPGRYPPPGTSPIADAIRARRGPRGITPLDAALLHVPPVAGGWNSLLGAVRSQGKLPGDVREIMILRVAAINRAAFEWIQHEKVGRTDGLTNAQLYIARDEATPLPPAPGILTPLQTSALMFADASTRNVKVGDQITNMLRKDLEVLAREQNAENVEERTQDLLAEAALVVATYNMVSRFLVAVDVAGLGDDEVPWPIERKESTVPEETTTIPSLASDISQLLESLKIPTPVHAVVGVSQGGAASLAFARSYPNLTRSVVACDTSPKTAPGNKEAWAGRIGLVYGGVGADEILRDGVKGGEAGKGADYAVKVGMGKLAEATVPRWFAQGSKCASQDAERGERYQWVAKMVEETPVHGFVAGAGALSNYDLYQGKSKHPAFLTDSILMSSSSLPAADEKSQELFKSPVEHVLLIAGSLDGGGNIGKGLQRLRDEWNAVRSLNAQAKPVEYVEIPSAGHLPMIDEADRYADVLRDFLDSI